MHARFKSLALAGVVSLMFIGQAQALSLDNMKDAAAGMLSGGEGGGSASMLSMLSSGSFNPGSLTNLVGVISYCQEQGYLGSPAEVAKNKALEQLGISSAPTEDSGYQQGLSGVLQGEGGQTFNLSSLGDMIGEKACGLVADQAMSFIGG